MSGEELAKYYAGGGNLEHHARALEKGLRMKLEDSGPFNKGESEALVALVDLMKSYHFLGIGQERELLEENQRMRNATSRIVERGVAELVRLAGEANTAVERGLYGISDELVSRMQEHMTELSELGRETMIHMQPLGQTGTRVDLVKVGGEFIYRREGFGDEEPGV